MRLVKLISIIVVDGIGIELHFICNFVPEGGRDENFQELGYLFLFFF